MEIKNVVATVTKDVFYAFLKRCKKEDISVGLQLATLIRSYANGANIIHVRDPKKKKHAKYTGASFPPNGYKGRDD